MICLSMLLCLSVVWQGRGVSLMAALIVSVEEATSLPTYNDPILVPGGFGEDVPAFNDRLHEWNGASTTNANAQPTIAGLGLVGKDYVQTDNDARSVTVSTGMVKMQLSADAQVFLFYDARNGDLPEWAVSMGFERIAHSGPTGYYRIGYDEATVDTELGVGAGVSIQQQAWIYTVRLAAGEHVFNGLGVPGNNNYGLVATEAGTVVGGVARLNGATPTPALQRLSFGDGVLAYVDRTHQWKVSSTVLTALPGLVGGDFIQMSNDARGHSANTPLYEVTLLEEAQVFLFLDNRFFTEYADLHPWMLNYGFTNTGHTIGIDEAGNGSIDQNATVYSTTLAAGYYQFNGLGMSSGMNQYGLVFSAVPEPTKLGLLMAASVGLFLQRTRRRSCR